MHKHKHKPNNKRNSTKNTNTGLPAIDLRQVHKEWEGVKLIKLIKLGIAVQHQKTKLKKSVEKG